MKKTDESIQINHSNSLRDPGYKIGIVLPSEITSTEVTLKNRIINFSNFHYINKLESSVDQGMIADRWNGLTIERSTNYAGAKAEYSGDGAINIQLRIE